MRRRNNTLRDTGARRYPEPQARCSLFWIPAFAGMTQVACMSTGQQLRHTGARRYPESQAPCPLFWIPAFAGMTHVACMSTAQHTPSYRRTPVSRDTSPYRYLAQNVLVEITPLRIDTFDQVEFPRTLPFLDLLLTLDRGGHRVVQFDIDEQVHAIFLREATNEALPVLPNPFRRVARDAGV